MKDIKLGISTCKRRNDEVYSYNEVLWSSLAKRLSKTTRTSETVAEYRETTKAEQSDIKDVGGYVLGYLKDGKRSKYTVLTRSAITLDLDHAPTDFWEQFTMLFPWASAAYSTHKHTPEHPRLRVIIPLARTVSPDEYEAIGRKIADDFMTIEWCDATTFQPSRMMFWPSTSKDGEFFYRNQEGDILDPDEILALYKGDWHEIGRASCRERV